MYFRHIQKVNCRKAARETALGRAAAKMIEMKRRWADRRAPYYTIYIHKGDYDRAMAVIQPALRNH